VSGSLQLYYAPRTRSRRALWCLEETGQPFERKALKLRAGEHKKPAYLAINPSGKVPALVDGKQVITESAAICAYLADKYPESGLAPNVTAPKRGAYLSWMFFAAGVMEPSFTDKRLDRVVTPKWDGAMPGTSSASFRMPCKKPLLYWENSSQPQTSWSAAC